MYDFAQASTSATSKQGRSARRALAGMDSADYADLPSKAKGKQRRRRGDNDDDDEDQDDESDESDDAGPIGPKVFDSDDELNAGIEGSDEELDSDEAFGESDEEKFDGWTFGRHSTKAQRKSKHADKRDEDEEQDDDSEEEGDEGDAQDEGMMDLSRMLDSASDSSDDEEDQDEEDDGSHDENDHSSRKLAKHIESFAAGSKRPSSHSKDAGSEAESDDEPSTKRSRRVLSERTEAIPETEFAAAHSGSTLRLEDFMNPLSSNIEFADVRKNTKLLSNPKSSSTSSSATPAASKKGGGALSAPLPSVVQDRLDRQGAYSITRDEVQGWQPTINRLRDAEHLSFPLQAPAKTKASTSGLVATFTPDNNMESSIAAMLTEAGLTEKQLAQQEDLAMNKLDPEEARARRDELRRMRMLMFRAEQKAKRVSKIKSKAYRKIHRKEKERLKAQMKELGAGPSDAEDALDSEGEMEERLKAERDRARERATLKHKNTSKWAKNILAARHGEHNQEARNELDAQLRRGAELRSKIQGRDIGDDSDSDPESGSDHAHGSDGEDGEGVARDAFDELSALEAKEEAKRRRDEQEFERVGGKKGVYNMKFMKDARERQYAQIRGDVDDFVAEMQALGAQDQDRAGSAGEQEEEGEQGDVVIARKRRGHQHEHEDEQGGSSVYVQGNKGRAMYGGAATAPLRAKAKPDTSPATVKGQPLSPHPAAAAASSSSTPVTAGADAGVEIGGAATRSKSKPTAKSPPSRFVDHNDDDNKDEDDDASNPWLVGETTASSGRGKLSRKKNDTVLSGSNGAGGAARSALRATKTASKSSASLAARKADESIEINLHSHLDSHATDSDSDAEAQPTPISQSRRPTQLQQRSLVSEAFTDDDVVTEFAREKAAITAAEAPQSINTHLPGWGSWSGKGLRPPTSSQKYTKLLPGIPKHSRKDLSTPHLIRAHHRDKKQDKFRRTDLPHPYTSLAHYSAALNQPLGKEWNTAIERQRLNLARVAAKPGKLIHPLRRKF